MNCINSTILGICFVLGSTVGSGAWLVEGPDVPVCIARSSIQCGELQCNYLGGILHGCSDLPPTTNQFFIVPYEPAPNEVIYVSFQTN
jgi:hypothetical protein